MQNDRQREGRNLAADFTALVRACGEMDWREEMTKVNLSLYMDICCECNRVIIPNRLKDFIGPRDFEEQIKANNWVHEGKGAIGSDMDHLCLECEQAGKRTFTCAICHQKRTSDLLYEDEYNEPECTICYSTMTAKAWDEWQTKQSERNRWFYSS